MLQTKFLYLNCFLLINVIFSLAAIAKTTSNENSLNDPVAQYELNVVTEINPPFQYKNKQGQLVGCSMDVLHALSNITNDKPTIKVLPWARAFATAENVNNTMILSMARNEIREHKFHWIGEIIEQKNVFWGLTSTYQNKKTSLEQVRKASIVTSIDSTADHILTAKNSFDLYRVATFSQGIQMLLSRRVDLIVAPKSLLIRQFKKLNLNFANIMPVHDMPELKYQLSIAMNIDSQPQLVQSYQQAFQQLKDNKVIDELTKPCI